MLLHLGRAFLSYVWPPNVHIRQKKEKHKLENPIVQTPDVNAELGTITAAAEEAKITSLGRLCLHLPIASSLKSHMQLPRSV